MSLLSKEKIGIELGCLPATVSTATKRNYVNHDFN